MSAQESGQAEYEAFRAAVPDHVCNVPAGPWEELSPAVRGGFAAIAALQGAEIRLLQMRLAAAEERAADGLAGLTAAWALKRLADPMPFGDQGKPLPPEAELRRDYAQAALDQAVQDGVGTGLRDALLRVRAALQDAPTASIARREALLVVDALDLDGTLDANRAHREQS